MFTTTGLWLDLAAAVATLPGALHDAAVVSVEHLLLTLAQRVADGCACADGCPSCVYLARRPGGNAVASRTAARQLLAVLTGRAGAGADPP